MSSNVEFENRSSSVDFEEVDRQLARLLASPHFSRSTRYPALLQFLVQQAQMGNAATLKERLIGIEVFHRRPDYDTNADPVVRVTAGEVRKRLAQYYQEPEHMAELRIDLLIGSYVPRFLPGHLSYSGNGTGSTIYDQGHTKEELHHNALPGVADHEADDAVADLPHNPTASTARSVPTPAEAAPSRPQDSLFTFSRRRAHFLLTLSLLVGVVLASVGMAISAWEKTARSWALRQLWSPLSSPGPLLFVVGDHSLDDNGHPLGAAAEVANDAETVLTRMNRRSQVPFEDMVSLEKIHAYLTRNDRAYRDKGAAEATLADLRSGPVVLFAGFDNRWSVQLSQQLPFRFVSDLEHSMGSIVDVKSSSRRWTLNFAQPLSHIDSDYGIVARYYDPMLENNVLLVAGIGSMGTAAASEFVTEERFSQEIVKAAPAGWKNGNFEVVLGAPVIEGQAGPPRIIASVYW